MSGKLAVLRLSWAAVLLFGCGSSEEPGSGGAGGAAGTGGTGGTGAIGGTGASGGTGGSAGSSSGTVAQIAVGRSHSCVRYQDARVACWGLNGSAELGRGGTAVEQWGVPAIASVIDSTTVIAAGWSTTCALKSGGAMWCWGKNQDGELGDGVPVPYSSDAVQVAGLSGVTAMAPAGTRTCAILTGGEVRCWGDNQFRQLGDGTSNDSLTPVSPLGLAGIDELDLSLTMHHACARSGGGVKCWGYNGSGQIGNSGATGFADSPVTMDGLDDAVAIGLGDHFTCVVRAGGTVACVGRAPLGDGTENDSKTLVTVDGLADAVQVVAGDAFACARKGDQTVVCWGRNPKGQLGEGTTTDALAPVAVTGLSDVVDVDAGGSHVCALTADATVYCWGNNEFGQVGPNGNVVPTPEPVSGL